MSFFRRLFGSKAAEEQVASGLEGQQGEGNKSEPAETDTDKKRGRPEATEPVARARRRGPWDVEEVDELGDRLDLGALWVPKRPGIQLRFEADRKTKQIISITIGYVGSQLQIAAFAAPRSEGIWEEIRGELSASITKQGGTAEQQRGPFGQELLARVPARTKEGRTGHRPMRFLGFDGPRWFLRGVVSGKAAVDNAAAAELEALFADVVVVRGEEARAPRDLLAIKPPQELLRKREEAEEGAQDAAAAGGDEAQSNSQA